MNAAESIINDRKTNEILMLRAFVEKTAKNVCAREVWGEVMTDSCLCYSCSSRETLATIDVMKEIYRHGPKE